MQSIKKALPHALAVVRGILFIGFSVQIVLGVLWMCRNFTYVQDFGEPDGVLYGRLFVLFGKAPYVLYILQLALAFWAGYLLLQRLCPVEPFHAVWRSLALLTFPFAMQCHLALQPYSIMGSLFLLMLSSLMEIRRKRVAGPLALALLCLAGFLAFSGAMDRGRQEEVGHSMEAALARRFAWPTMWNDFGRFSDELKELTEDVVWEASVCPDNMGILESALEGRVGEEAKGYYMEMARVGWTYHAPMIIRQIGWDVLGYVFTPPIFQLQLQGDAYDAYSGRNYEIMRGNSPVLTRNYIDYCCWWFGCTLGLNLLSILLGALEASGRKPEASARFGRRKALRVGICVCASGILTAVLTMRGAGTMDYKYTIAISDLWIAWVLLSMSGKRQERK